MSRRRRSVDELMQDLVSESPEMRVSACVELRELGADARLATPALVAALNDDRFVLSESGPDPYGGEGAESRFYVSSQALATLAEIAPDAAADEVARALVRLQGQLRSTHFMAAGPAVERSISWHPQELKPFGYPLLEALRRIEEQGSDEEREKAKVLADKLGRALGTRGPST